MADQQHEQLGKATPGGESSRGQKHRARRHFSFTHTQHMGCKKLTLEGNEPVWLLSGTSCSLDAFSRVKMSDLLFALDRPHTATEPTATRMLSSTREESAQAENHSLHPVWTSVRGSAAQQRQPTARDQQLPSRIRDRKRGSELVPDRVEWPFQGHSASKSEE